MTTKAELEHLEKSLQELRQKGLFRRSEAIAGHCGKCGAPYFQDGHTGALRPICACWNLSAPLLINEGAYDNDKK